MNIVNMIFVIIWKFFDKIIDNQCLITYFSDLIRKKVRLISRTTRRTSKLSKKINKIT